MSKARFNNLADLLNEISIPVSEIKRIIDQSDITTQKLTDHIEALDPHTQYYNQLRGDNRYVRNSVLAQPNGVATLNDKGKVVFNQLPDAALGGLDYQGSWNANTNTPILFSSQSVRGYFYKVSVAGNTELDGITDWKVGDWAIYNGDGWQKIDQTEVIQTVNGLTGAVVLKTDNVDEGTTNLYYTDQRASDAAPVQSIHGRTGDVVGVDADYNAAKIVYDPATSNLLSNRVQSVVEEVNTKLDNHIDNPSDPHPQYTTPLEAANAAPVQTIHSRTGNVVATDGDYDATKIIYNPATSDLFSNRVQSVVEEVNTKINNHIDNPSDPHPQYTTETEAAAAAPIQSINTQTGVVVLDTDDMGEGLTNLYFTNTRASTAIKSDAAWKATNWDSAYGWGDHSLAGYELKNNKGQINGYASLGGDGKVPSAQLPSFVDDVLEYSSETVFPATGEAGKMYIALDTNKVYRWSGSTYVYITSGAVDSVNNKTGVIILSTSDIDEGTNLYHTTTRAASAAPVQSVDGKTGAVTLDYDNYGGWALQTNGTARGSVTAGEVVNFAAGANVSLSYSTTNNTITINSTDTNTDTNTTYSAGGGLTLSGTTFSLTGDSFSSNGNYTLLRAQATTKTDVGLSGIPNTNASTVNYLRGDGAWVTPPDTNTDTNYYLNGLSFATATGVLTASVNGTTNQTVDLDGRYLLATSKAADSQKLDNLDSTQFVRSDANDIITGDITMSGRLSLTGENGPALAVSRGSGKASIEPTAGETYLMLDGPTVGLNWYNAGDVILANGGGEVGIGTSAPIHKLDVNGDVGGNNFHATSYKSEAGTGSCTMQYNDTSKSLEFNFS